MDDIIEKLNNRKIQIDNYNVNQNKNKIKIIKELNDSLETFKSDVTFNDKVTRDNEITQLNAKLTQQESEFNTTNTINLLNYRKDLEKLEEKNNDDIKNISNSIEKTYNESINNVSNDDNKWQAYRESALKDENNKFKANEIVLSNQIKSLEERNKLMLANSTLVNPTTQPTLVNPTTQPTLVNPTTQPTLVKSPVKSVDLPSDSIVDLTDPKIIYILIFILLIIFIGFMFYKINKPKIKPSVVIYDSSPPPLNQDIQLMINSANQS